MGKREVLMLEPRVHEGEALEDGSTFTNGYTWSNFCGEGQEQL